MILKRFITTLHGENLRIQAWEKIFNLNPNPKIRFGQKMDVKNNNLVQCSTEIVNELIKQIKGLKSLS